MPEIQSAVLPKPDGAEIRARMATLKEELISRALAKGIITVREEAVVRSISPKEDFGFTRDVWEESVTENVWVNVVQALEVKGKVIGIAGIRNDAEEPITTAIRFGLGWPITTVRGYFHVQSEYLEPEVITLFSKDIIYDEGERMTIQQYARKTGTDGLIYLGLVCEKIGVTVSE